MAMVPASPESPAKSPASTPRNRRVSARRSDIPCRERDLLGRSRRPVERPASEVHLVRSPELGEVDLEVLLEHELSVGAEVELLDPPGRILLVPFGEQR